MNTIYSFIMFCFTALSTSMLFGMNNPTPVTNYFRQFSQQYRAAQPADVTQEKPQPSPVKKNEVKTPKKTSNKEKKQ